MKIVIIGPAHPLRGGGMTTFNHRLAQQFIFEGHDCSIVSFSLQYPSFLFPGKSQYSDERPPENLVIHTWINSINPLNWIRVGNRIRKMQPDLVVVRFWLPFMGPALGTILRRIRQNKHSKIICIADNVIPHEKRIGDKPFTRYFLAACDGFITMSEKVLRDLRSFENRKPALQVPHPLYDNFGEAIPKEDARDNLGLPSGEKILLFFGFIRHYKGLDILLKALAHESVRNQNIRLLVAGEFYEDETRYRQLLEELDVKDQLYLHTDFIKNDDVKNYFCAADCVVQPYRAATQSGVTPLAYHFEKPMIVTNVGGLPAMVPHKKVGLVAEPEPTSLREAILEFYAEGEASFVPNLQIEKKKYSWSKLSSAIIQISNTNA